MSQKVNEQSKALFCVLGNPCPLRTYKLEEGTDSKQDPQSKHPVSQPVFKVRTGLRVAGVLLVKG